MIFLGLTPKLPALTCYVVFLYTCCLLYLEKGCLLSSPPLQGSPRFNSSASYCVKLSPIPLQNELFLPLCDQSTFFMFLFPLSTCVNLICVRLVFPTGF